MIIIAKLQFLCMSHQGKVSISHLIPVSCTVPLCATSYTCEWGVNVSQVSVPWSVHLLLETALLDLLHICPTAPSQLRGCDIYVVSSFPILRLLCGLTGSSSAAHYSSESHIAKLSTLFSQNKIPRK